MDYVSYVCKFCSADLDGGDIFEYFLKQMDRKTALEAAKGYGWSETNKIHFNKAIIVQPDRGEQYTICAYCKNKDPLSSPLA
jgi:hypothetical protein